MKQFPPSNITIEENHIRTLITIYDVNKRNYQKVPVIIDTGATQSLIPTRRLINLGYDIQNAPRAISQTPKGEITVLTISITKITALGKSVENIEVKCREPNANIPEQLKRTGLLGMNFLQYFDNINISFPRNLMTLS